MPQIGNITVKKNDGVTDVVYTAVVPSAGDKSPAIFKSNSVGTSANARPEFRVSSLANRQRTTRVVEGNLVYPTTVTENGVTSVAHRTLVQVRVTVPQGAPDTDIAEAVSQGVNLLGSVLMRDTFKSGYAPS